MSPININFDSAKEVSFEPLPRGTYNAVVFDASWTEVQNEGGKLPVGTPRLNVQFKITAPEEYAERRVFNGYNIPPEDYEKKQMMIDMLFTFLRAIGYSDTEIKKWKGQLPDPDEFAGRECNLQLTQREFPKGSGEMQNSVTAVKPFAPLAVGAGAGGLSDL
jgi:hypothetical protein